MCHELDARYSSDDAGLLLRRRWNQGNPRSRIASSRGRAARRSCSAAGQGVRAEQVAGYVPENTVTLVRINGIAQAGGGAALATGKGRRLGALLLAGSLIPSTIAKHPFWTVQDPEERVQERTHFLKNVSLLGGVLLASQDTEGKPSLAWRAQKGGESIAKETRRASKKLAKSTNRAAGSASDLAEAAVVTGAALWKPSPIHHASCNDRQRGS